MGRDDNWTKRALFHQLEKNHTSTGEEAIMLYCISPFVHKCLHKWVCVWVPLTCVIFSVKGASVNCCSFPMLSSLGASFDWTLGCLNRWRHREPNQPCNSPQGLPPCFYRITWRMCCTTMPCVSLAIREAGFKMRYDVKSALERVPRLQPAVIFFTYRWFVSSSSRLLHPFWFVHWSFVALLILKPNFN